MSAIRTKIYIYLSLSGFDYHPLNDESLVSQLGFLGAAGLR